MLRSRRATAGMMIALALYCGRALGQEPVVPKEGATGDQAQASGAPVALTLKRAIQLALQNSKDIQVAKIQSSMADHAAQITKAQFMPNLYAGSGAG